MKARTKFQQRVAAANGRLLPITEKQTEWAFRHTVRHYAFRTPSGRTTCLDCGYRWNETKTKHCHCPNCHAKLTLKDTLCRKTDEKSYFSVITTQDGFQVQRIFRMTVYYHKSRKARTDVCEVARYWMDENGKTALTALQRAMGRYLDCFLYGSGLELRNDNYVYRHIADCYVYPKYTVIPKLRRNGLKGSFSDIAPQKLMKALLSDSRVETILKSGRKRDLKYFIDHAQDLDLCWSSYKIVLRQKYRIKGMGIWADYLRMLDRCPLCLPCRFESRTRQVPEQGAYSPRTGKTHGADETGEGKRGTFQGVERQVLRSGVHGWDDSRPCTGQRGSLLRRGQCITSLRRTVRILPQTGYAGILRTDRKQEGRDR